MTRPDKALAQVPAAQWRGFGPCGAGGGGPEGLGVEWLGVLVWGLGFGV